VEQAQRSSTFLAELSLGKVNLRCACSTLLLACLIPSAFVFAQGPKAGLQPVTVVLDKVVEKEVAADQTFIGTLEPRRRSTVGSAVDGRVEQYPVNDGQWVKKGDVVAELLKETINIEVKNAEAELAFRDAELEEYKNGALQEDKDQAAAKVASADAHLRYAKARYTRTEAIFQRGTGITQEDMDLAYSNLTNAEEELRGAKAALRLLETWPRPEKLAQAKARRDAQAEMVNQLKDRLAKYTIRAPFDGYVVEEHTEVGAWISRGDKIVEVIEVDPIEVVISVPESFIPSLQEAMADGEANGSPLQGQVLIDALSTDKSAGRFPADVERIVPQADVRSRTFPVKLWLKNDLVGKSHRFKAGMICHVKLPVGKAQKAMLVPKDALVLGGKTPVVFVADKVTDPASKKESVVARPVPVEIGSPYGSLIPVTGDLKPGTPIVVRGNERLIPGQPLRVAKSE